MTPQLAHPPRDTDIRHDHGGPVLAVRSQESSALLSQRRAVAGEGDGRFARRVWPRVAAHPGLWRWLRLRYLSALAFRHTNLKPPTPQLLKFLLISISSHCH
ncbi:uncharacterized protein LOC120667438 [Panicum virgatum]|nr:uncharacterized protein LOC120667438 [Panicum virgatum]